MSRSHLEKEIWLLDRIQGALFGLAIGDALGGTTEFMSVEEIRDKYGYLTGIVGGGCWNLEPGETTDDTAMSLCVARGIIETPEDPISAIGKYFLDWYESDPKDIGMTVRLVLDSFTGDWPAAAKAVHEHLGGRSGGNGTLMRTLPVALAYPVLEKMESVTELQSNMTHYDSAAAEACLIYNRIAYRILNGEEMEQAVKQEATGTIYASMLREKPTVSPDGYVVHTMRWVLYWLTVCDDFEDVVQRAANQGDDSDTVAAIAGGLAGLVVGYRALPEKYREKILLKEELLKVADGLLKVRVKYNGLS